MGIVPIGDNMSRIEKTLEKATGPGKSNNTHGADSGTMPGSFEPKRTKEMSLSSTHPCIITYHEPDAPAAEEYRKLKTVLLNMTREDFRNTLMVTSALSGEGKSITSANLAIMLARDYGQTVLLIDADLRRPSLHEYLGIENSVGLTDCLEDNVDIGRAIVKTGIPKLSFLSAGKKPADPAELLSSQRMKDCLAEVKHRYRDRYILVDTPPILLFAETHAISMLVDGVLVVVKEGVAPVKGIRQMLELLKVSSVLGIIYNDASAANLDGRYHHYYSYYKRDIQGKKKDKQ